MSDWVVSIALWYNQGPLRKLLEEALRALNHQNERSGKTKRYTGEGVVANGDCRERQFDCPKRPARVCHAPEWGRTLP